LIATGSKAGFVRIYKLTESVGEGVSVGGGGYTIEMVGQFQHQGGVFSDVQRVSWNVTGTVLSSSGDDGRIRIWKEDHLGIWKQQVALSAEQYLFYVIILTNQERSRLGDGRSGRQLWRCSILIINTDCKSDIDNDLGQSTTNF
jgi:WD40 repeat protein